MERKVGELFIYEDKTYQVVEGFGCIGCSFIEGCYTKLYNTLGICAGSSRTDKTNVIFKEIPDMKIKNNQLTIEIPKGMEIDIENSDLTKGIVKFKPKSLTYKDILQTYITEYGDIVVPKRNVSKLLAISKLMNIAKYYNKDWRPDWEHREVKYYIYFDNNDNKYDIDFNDACCRNTIYFKNSKDAKAVIDNPNFREILDAIYK